MRSPADSKLKKVLSLLLMLAVGSLAQTTRRDIKQFTIETGPFQRALTQPEVNTVRDITEVGLTDSLKVYPWEFGAELDFLGLTRTTSEYDEQRQRMIVTMDGGLIYFTDDTTEFAIPDEQQLAAIVLEALDGNDAILERLQSEFSAVAAIEYFTVAYGVPTDSPTHAPTVSPTEGASSEATDKKIAPSPIPDSANKGVNGGSSSDDNISTGTMVGAGIGITGLLLLIGLFVQRRRKSSNTIHGGGLAKRAGESDLESTLEDPCEEDDEETARSKRWASAKKADSVRSPTPHETSDSSHRRKGSKDEVQPVPLENEDSYEEEEDFGGIDDATTFSDFDGSSVMLASIPVKTMESFEQRHRQVVLRKDMLTTPRGQSDNYLNYWDPKIDRSNRCALAPTDVSAATLAIADREDDHDRSIPQFDVNRARQEYNSTGGYHSSSETDTFGAAVDDDLWDPDDTSLGTDSDIGNMQVVNLNKDEQSLLHHSLRNESYKMQRLRTPQNSALGKSSSSENL